MSSSKSPEKNVSCSPFIIQGSVGILVSCDFSPWFDTEEQLVLSGDLSTTFPFAGVTAFVCIDEMLLVCGMGFS